MMNVDTKLLVIFTELLQKRNASYVAEKMHLTAPAVSHSLNRLREIFNDPLFTRVPHGLVPTPRAIELGPQVQRMLDLWADIGENVRRFDPASASGKLTIAYSESFGDTLMSQFALDIRRLAPHFHLVLKHVEMEDGGLAGLLSGEFDLVAAPGVNHHAGLLYEDVWPLEQWVCWRAGHPILQNTCSAEQFRSLKHIVSSIPADNEQIQVAVQVPNWVAKASLTSQTDYLCVLNSFTRAMAEPVFSLRSAPVPAEFATKSNIVLHWQAGRQHQPMLQWARGLFVESCRRQAAQHVTWLNAAASQIMHAAA